MPHAKNVHVIGLKDQRCAQLANVLGESGWQVSVSDFGGSADKINKGLFGVIVASDIDQSNPELIKAKELKVPVYSYAGFIRLLATDKQRIVITGSHGLRKIASLVSHILRFNNRIFDYSFTDKGGESHEIRLSNASYMLIEGNDTIEPTTGKPEFMTYEHHMGLISGIDRKKSESSTSEEEYAALFRAFADATPKAGVLLYNELDPVVKSLFSKPRTDVVQVPFVTPHYEYEDGIAIIHNDHRKPISLGITGSRNMLYINAAKELVKKIGINSDQFYDAIISYEGKTKSN